MLINLSRSFARTVKRPVPFSVAKEKADDDRPIMKPESGKRKLIIQDRRWMAKRFMPVTQLPDKLLKAAQKIFSGKKSKSIKE